MEIEKRTLYNLLRMNWQNDPSLDVEEWQVENYRSHSTRELIATLQSFDIPLDQQSYIYYAEEAETPEHLTELLLEGKDFEPQEQDHVYLLVFELWRRLFPERLTLSIFCDELDHQIYLYDQGNPSSAESIQDIIANMQMIMDENADQGLKPQEIFDLISRGSANDLESFLYDYFAEQIDSDNIPYATELLEGFGPYLKGNKWFDLLEIRIKERIDPDEAHEQLKKLVQKVFKEDDLTFNLEVLSFLVQGGDTGEFVKMLRKTVPLLKTEEDFLDLLVISADYFRCLDEDQKEQDVQRLIDSREKRPLSEAFDSNDQDLEKLLKIIR